MKAHAKLASSLSLGLLLAACGAAPDAATQDQVVEIAEDDAEMNAAIRKARAELDGFLALAAAPPPGTSDYKIKVELSDKNGTEHFWVQPFERTASGFRGTLANAPQLVESVKEGEVFDFGRQQVSDWGYVRDGKQVGSFTVCVMMKRVPKEEADQYRKEYGFEC